MSSAVIAVAAGLGLAGITGWLLTHRSGVLAETGPGSGRPADPDTSGLELADGEPTVVHFSAPWCGPCAGVRRVVNQVCSDLGGVAHVEFDIDASPATARKLSVLSLPTIVIFDAHGGQRYRATGVPAAADLRSALEPLLV
jgi:thiol-disulfide isomerase/thioredoxin